MKSRIRLDKTRVLPKVVRFVMNFLIFGLMLIRNFKENIPVLFIVELRGFLRKKKIIEFVKKISSEKIIKKKIGGTKSIKNFS